MQLPEDYDQHSGMTPAVVMTIVAVTLFVAAILVIVLLINQEEKGRGRHSADAGKDQFSNVGNASAGEDSPIIFNDPSTEGLTSGSQLHPQDFDFWDLYPPKETQEPAETEAPQEVVENDPATDGRHTLVKNVDGTEEWVLINSFLPKHEYDFTKLVCQSNLMKYFENGKQVSYEGINISEVQDYVDFVAVKKSGIDFVMLRVGARGYGTGQLILDEYFTDNLKRATDAGLDVGVYFFSQAITEKEAIEEANMVIESLGEYSIAYPVAYDMERIPNDSSRTDTLSKSDRTNIAKAFLEQIEKAGYKTLIYGNKEWLIKQIDMSKLTAYDVWLSQEADIPDYPYRFTMWQYNRGGTVNGVAGYVDLNISFVDYSEK